MQTLYDFLAPLLAGGMAERIPVMIAAMVIALIFGLAVGAKATGGNPSFWWLVECLFGKLGARLDRLQRGRRDLILRGAFVTLAACLFALALAVVAAVLIHGLPFGGIAMAVLLAACLSGGGLWPALLRLYRALRQGGQAARGAFYMIARGTRLDLSGSDDYGITRAGISYAARSFDKGTVAPLFWFLIGGLPLAVLYAAVAALTWRFGKDGFTKGFGAAALTLEKAMGFAPSLLAAAILALAALFTPTAMMSRGLAGLFAATGRQPYVQGGPPVTVMAYALGVSLGGPATDLDGSSLPRDWSGPPGATARLEPGHLKRALYISVLANILLITLLLCIMVFSGNALF